MSKESWWNRGKKKKKDEKSQGQATRRKLDESIENSKAVVIIDGKPVFGTISKVNAVEASEDASLIGKVFVSLLTKAGDEKSFEATAKLAKDEFKLISDEVYKTLTKEVKNKKIGANGSDLTDVKVDSVVETMILSGRYQGIWVKSKVTSVEDDTMDLKVIKPKKWKVAGTALAVPNKFIRVVKKEDLDNYVVPVEFAMDDSKLYLSCNARMRIKHLKTTVSQQRAVQPNQLIFVNKGTPLLEKDPIPDDAIFCIVCQKGGLTSNQMNLLSQSMKKKNAATGPDLEQQNSIKNR